VGRLIWQVNVSVDGFIEGPAGELDRTGQIEDEEFERYAGVLLRSVDAVLLGRVTYQLFEKVWPRATGADADRLNELAKIVFSSTLERVEWRNARLVRGDAAAEVARLRREGKGDMVLFGSATLASSLMRAGMVDEVRFLVTPFVLGGGKRAFRGGERPAQWKLQSATRWKSGIVALHYAG
jgi:dihydrofolate reductase